MRIESGMSPGTYFGGEQPEGPPTIESDSHLETKYSDEQLEELARAAANDFEGVSPEELSEILHNLLRQNFGLSSHEPKSNNKSSPTWVQEKTARINWIIERIYELRKKSNIPESIRYPDPEKVKAPFRIDILNGVPHATFTDPKIIKFLSTKYGPFIEHSSGVSLTQEQVETIRTKIIEALVEQRETDMAISYELLAPVMGASSSLTTKFSDENSNKGPASASDHHITVNTINPEGVYDAPGKPPYNQRPRDRLRNREDS